MVREATLEETALALDEDNTLRDSLGPTASSHAKAQARKLRGQNARDRQQRQERWRQRERRRQQQPQNASTAEPPHDGGHGRGGSSGRVAGGDGLNGGNGSVDRREDKGAGRWAEGTGSTVEGAAAGGDVGWGETAYAYNGTEKGEKEEISVAGEGADLVSWGCRRGLAYRRISEKAFRKIKHAPQSSPASCEMFSSLICQD